MSNAHRGDTLVTQLYPEGDRNVPPSMTSAAPPGGQDMSPMFVWMEINRRMDGVVRRIERLDEYGSRGVDGLRTEVARLRQDFGDHETAHEQARRDQVSGRRWLIGILIAVITPLYPLLLTGIYLVVKTHG
jgi:hypothetical protein